jgi:hypothetical protein
VFAAAARHAPLSVERLLLSASRLGSIVPLAPLVALLAAMVLTATERAAEIPPMGIPWMGQKADATMAAADRTAYQTGAIAQNSIERQLILTNKRVGAVALMPIGTKFKIFRNRYRKNARFSVKMWSDFFTPSSYSLDANASRCRARIFCAC